MSIPLKNPKIRARNFNKFRLVIFLFFGNISLLRKKDCGYSSVVERDLAKVDVARSNRVTRSFLFIYLTTLVTKKVKKHVKILKIKII